MRLRTRHSPLSGLWRLRDLSQLTGYGVAEMILSPEIILVGLNILGTAGIWTRLGAYGKGIAELERRMTAQEAKNDG